MAGTTNAGSERKPSIFWTSQTLRRALPWDTEQWIEVKRHNERDKKRMARMMLEGVTARDIETNNIDAIRALDVSEWERGNSIIDFELLDDTGAVIRFDKGNGARMREVIESFGDDLNEFVDNLIKEVNKSSKEAEAELEGVEKNSDLPFE